MSEIARAREDEDPLLERLRQRFLAFARRSLASWMWRGNKVTGEDAIVGADLYIEAAPTVNMAATAISSVGGSQPHTNFQPYLCVDFIISLFGIFPSPT